MSTLFESLLVAVVVGLALVWAVRAVWRYFRGDGSCSGCGSEGGCGGGEPQELVKDLAPMPGSRQTPARKPSSGSSSTE